MIYDTNHQVILIKLVKYWNEPPGLENPWISVAKEIVDETDVYVVGLSGGSRFGRGKPIPNGPRSLWIGGKNHPQVW